MMLLTIISAEIARYIALNGGIAPELATIPPAIYDALIAEQRNLKFDPKFKGDSMRIMGVKILRDPDRNVLTFFK